MCAAACSALLFCFVTPLRSHDPITTKLTWTREISRIAFKRCGSCHHDGGKAMDLTTYELARPWAKAIRDEVLSRRMPPWGAVKGIGEFVGDPSLSQPEIDMLVTWVEGGAPEGEPASLPQRRPMYKTGEPARGHTSTVLTVMSELTLKRTVAVVALRPKDIEEGGSLEGWTVKPDGAVVRLIQIRDYRKTLNRDYVLLAPLALPAGTRLRVSATSGSLLVYCR